MLPKQHRLPALFMRDVMRGGNTVHTPLFVFIYKKATSSISRFGFVAGIKVSKLATKRNYAKRMLRESVRHGLPHFTQPVDGIFVAKKAILGATQQGVENLVTTVSHI